MKFTKFNVLGVGLALALPTAAVAVTLPNTFNEGDVISATEMNANFNALSGAVDSLVERVDVLENNKPALPSTLSLSTTFAEPVITLQASESGMLYVRPGGTGYRALSTRIYVGDGQGSDGHASCGGGNCPYATRVHDGDSSSVLIPAGAYVTILVNFDTANEASAALFWQPLDERRSAAPTVEYQGD